MPPRMHPHSNYTTSLFGATLFVSFMVVGLPHIIPCPAPRTIQYAENRPRRDQQRDRQETGHPASANSEKRYEEKLEPPWEIAGASGRSERQCPVPKPGGIIGRWLGFPQPKERPDVRIESRKATDKQDKSSNNG